MTISHHAREIDKFWTIAVTVRPNGKDAVVDVTGEQSTDREKAVLHMLCKRAIKLWQSASKCDCERCTKMCKPSIYCCLVFSTKTNNKYLVSGWDEIFKLSGSSIGSIEVSEFNPVLPEDN